MTAEEFYRKRLIEQTPEGARKRLMKIVDISMPVQICKEFADHQNKKLIDKAENLMFKHFGFTEDGGIIAEEQLKIFEILEQLKKVK